MDNSYDKTTGPSTDVTFFSITWSSEGRKIPQKVLDKIQHIATPTRTQGAQRLTGSWLLEATHSTSSRDLKTIMQLLEKQRRLNGHSPTGSPKSKEYLQTDLHLSAISHRGLCTEITRLICPRLWYLGSVDKGLCGRLIFMPLAFQTTKLPHFT